MKLVDIRLINFQLHKVYRNWKNELIKEPIEDFFDYFYVSDERLEDIKNIDELITTNNGNSSPQILRIEETDTPALFYDGKVHKVLLKNHWSRYKFKKFLDENLDGIFEFDIAPEMRYTLDNISEIEDIKYKTLFFDIETSTDNGFPDWENAQEKITCITMYNNYEEKYITLILNPEEKQKSSDLVKEGDIIWFNKEKELINYFIKYVRTQEFDILTAWNIAFDLSYIIGRCTKLGIQYHKLSESNRVEIRKRMNKQNREDLYINIGGTFVVDLLLKYKGILFHEIPSYALEYVAKKELGEDMSKMKVLDFSKEWREHTDRLVDYSIRDVKILVELDKKLNLLGYMEELRKISILPNIVFAEVAKNIIDMQLFREYQGQLIFPSRSNLERVRFGGGFIKAPTPGIHKYVAVYDFSGLYPSLIRTFNLSKDTIVPEDKADFVTYEDDLDEIDTVDREGYKTGWSLAKKGIIPTILTRALTVRKRIKKEMKELDPNSIKYRAKNLEQYALKAPINANYGVNAYPGFRLYEPRVAATITWLGRSLNRYCSKRIEEEFGLKVVYGDTDSFFVEMNEDNIEKAKEILEVINDKFVYEFVSQISNGKISREDTEINVELEKIFDKVLLIKKRRYLGTIYWKDKILNESKWEFKGVDLKRSNIPEGIKDLLLYYVNNLFEDKNETDIMLHCIRSIRKLSDIDKLKVPLKISKQYSTNLPQKRAAIWANKNLNSNYKEGSKFYGLYVDDSSTDIIGFQNIEQLDDFKIKIDYEKYEKILRDKIKNLRGGRKAIDPFQKTLDLYAGRIS